MEKPGGTRVSLQLSSLIYPSLGISGSGEAGRTYSCLTDGETEARDGARREKTR